MTEPLHEFSGINQGAPSRSAYEVITRIMQSNPTIESLTLVTYAEGPNWRDLLNKHESAELTLLLKGLQQDQGERNSTKLPRREVSAENLRRIAQSLSNNRLLGAISKANIAGGGVAHIPMMDFVCTPTSENLGALVRLLGDLRQGPGFLLESGRSYHYYAFRLLGEEEWRIFLGKCLLMSGYSDDRYIGHQLVDGHCVLRLSSGKSKASVPTVVVDLS